MKLVLKKATLTDSKDLARFNKNLIDDGGCINSMSEIELEGRMKQFLELDYLAYFFIVDNKKIGYVLVNVRQKPFFIRHFYIIKEYRRKGYGTMAFNRLVEILDISEIDLTVLVQNEIGYKFWISCGLIPHEITMHYCRVCPRRQ